MHIVHLIDKQRTKMTRMYNTIDKINYCKHKIDYNVHKWTKMYWTLKWQECSPNWPKSLQNCQNAQRWTINYLVRVAVRGRPPVLQVAVTLLSNLSGDPTQAGGNYDFFFMSIQKGQWKNIVESSVYVIFLSLKFITLSSNRLLIIATSLMLQPLLATPAEKSWIEEVSWAPVSLLSLSWREKEHIVVYKSWRESYTYSIAYCRLQSNLSRKHGYEKSAHEASTLQVVTKKFLINLGLQRENTRLADTHPGGHTPRADTHTAGRHVHHWRPRIPPAETHRRRTHTAGRHRHTKADTHRWRTPRTVSDVFKKH